MSPQLAPLPSRGGGGGGGGDDESMTIMQAVQEEQLEDDLVCVCRERYVEGEFMLQCGEDGDGGGGCGRWFQTVRSLLSSSSR